MLKMENIAFLGIILVVWQSGTADAVKCYLCSSKDNETMCRDPEWYNLPLVKCDQMALENTRSFARRIELSYNDIFEIDTSDMAKNLDLHCLKVITRVGEKDFTFRGCQLAEHSYLDICVKMDKIKTDYLRKIHCSRCGTDGCNLASNPPKLTISVLFSLILISFINLI